MIVRCLPGVFHTRRTSNTNGANSVPSRGGKTGLGWVRHTLHRAGLQVETGWVLHQAACGEAGLLRWRAETLHASEGGGLLLLWRGDGPRSGPRGDRPLPKTGGTGVEESFGRRAETEENNRLRQSQVRLLLMSRQSYKSYGALGDVGWDALSREAVRRLPRDGLRRRLWSWPRADDRYSIADLSQVKTVSPRG